jgi:glycosyltransferase 2 family protein
VLHDVKWAQVGSALRQANYLLLIPSLALLGLLFTLRTVRWNMLLYPLQNLRFSRLFGSITVAYLINNTLPFQLGDLGRAYLLGELEGVRKSRTLSTVIVERIIDVLTLVALLLVLVPFIGVPSWLAIPAAILGVSFLLLGSVALVAALRRHWIIAIVNHLPAFVPEKVKTRLESSAHSAVDGLSVLSNPWRFTRVIALTIVQWMVSAAALYLVMMAFDLHVGFDAAIFVMIVVSFGFLIPASPGSIGVYHALSIKALAVYGVGHDPALSYAFVAHLLYYLPPIVIGLVFLWQQQLGWQKLRAIAGGAESVSEEGGV